MQRVGDLEIDQDLRFYRAFRVIERWAPWVLLAAVVAAALGAFGYGWLGRDTVSVGPLARSSMPSSSGTAASR